MREGSSFIVSIEALDLGSALENVARKQPQADAILAPGRKPLSYAGLMRQLADVCSALNLRGIGRGDRVAVVLQNGPEAAVAFLGITSCAIFVPLNPDYTHEEFDTYLTQLRPTAIVVPAGHDTPVREVARRLGIPTIDLVVEDDAPAGRFTLTGGDHKSCSMPGPSQAEDVALLLLSSGTTTKPKIIPVRHRQMMIDAQARVERLELGPEDRTLNVMPLFHGHGLFMVLPLLLAGGSAVCMARFEIKSFFECLKEYSITCYSASFPIHEAIAEQLPNHSRLVDQTNVRFIKVGSGRLDPRIVKTLEEDFGALVIEGYSTTESCIVTLNPLDRVKRKQGTVGIPVSGEVAILGEAGELLPAGEAGEIIIRGPCVFDGYLDDPEANAAAFHKGWFRSGDLGHLDEDGFLSIIGRIKEIINRGGEKIAPLEVDDALQKHPAVAVAATFGFTHPTVGQEVAAAVILHDEKSLEEEELIRFVRIRLSHFKVPRRIFFVDDLPRTAAGKIQKNKLSEIFACELQQPAKPARDAAAKSNATPLEAALTAVWKSVLDLDDIRPDDDFFLLGGDSLLAATLFAEVSAIFGIELPLKTIFDDAATIEDMACIIENTRNMGGNRVVFSPKSSDVVIMNGDGDLPALFAVGGNGGHSLGFAHVARLLGPNQPFFGLDSVGLDGAVEPLTRMEDIAAEHIRRLQKMRHEGPYYLIGACFGGRVVYEMTQQLARDGHEVGLAILLDPSPPFMGLEDDVWPSDGRVERLPRSRATRLFLLARLKLYWSEFLALPWNERHRLVYSKLKVVKEIAATGKLYRGNPTELYRDAVYRANKIAGASYIAAPYSGPVAIFWSKDRKIGARKHREEWLSLLANPLIVAEVPGNDSSTMALPPNVETLTKKIADCLCLARGG